MGEVIALRAKSPVAKPESSVRRQRLGRMIRVARGDLTQVELGARLGMRQPAVSAWEAGKVALSPELLWAIETALDLQHGWLSVAGGFVDPSLDPLHVLLEASVQISK